MKKETNQREMGGGGCCGSGFHDGGGEGDERLVSKGCGMGGEVEKKETWWWL